MGRRVAILFNPRAGRGRAASAAARLRDALCDAGHVVRSLEVGDVSAPLATSDLDAELLIVLGGDGTLHHALPLAVELDIPVYHAPLGTENLIPREFAFAGEPATIVRAIDRWNIHRVDLGMCGTTPFAIMASVGFDANVIHRVHAERSARIRRATYLLPILREMLHGDAPRVSIMADGREIVRDKPGVAIVANCRQYGFGFNPAPDASMTDGLLDAVFMPAASAGHLIAWAARARLQRHTRHASLVSARAREIVVEVDREQALYQMDGEAYVAGAVDVPGTDGGQATTSPASRLSLSVRASELALLDAC